MTAEPDETLLKEASRLVAEASSILVITGAGMSADSGLPTYRGIGGLYEQQITEEGLAIEEALSGAMLKARPDICWKYIHQIESSCRGASPNPGHRALARLEQRKERLWVLTQNVDGFHRQAGSLNVISIHGDIHDLFCIACDWKERVADYAGLRIPPSCPDCGALVRPRVVLFGELLPDEETRLLMVQLALGFDLVMSVGTTSVFPYIAGPVMDAARRGVPTIEINPGDTAVSDVVDLRLRLGAAEALGAVLGDD